MAQAIKLTRTSEAELLFVVDTYSQLSNAADAGALQISAGKLTGTHEALALLADTLHADYGDDWGFEVAVQTKQAMRALCARIRAAL